MADVPGAAANAACATDFAATAVPGDPNAVVVRIHDPAGPFTGTITAYAGDRVWTGKIERSTTVDRPRSPREVSLVVRAGDPIEGVAYSPDWATCTFHAGTRARNGYDAPDVERPVLSLADPQPVEPASCAQPYVSPVAIHAVEPYIPAIAIQERIQGTVRVGVSLDERGMPLSTRIITSPSVVLNASALNAARRSQYRGAVFRCKPVPSGYEFTVDYSAG